MLLLRKFRYMKMKEAFTLAESLITMAVVGVVAVIVIPSMTQNIQARVRTRQVEVAQLKFNKAAQLMTLNSEMGPYYSSTQDFVSNFSKYMKINTICRVGDSPSELPPVTDCFGDNYKDILMSDGTAFPLKDIKTGAQFRLDNNDNND